MVNNVPPASKAGERCVDDEYVRSMKHDRAPTCGFFSGCAANVEVQYARLTPNAMARRLDHHSCDSKVARVPHTQSNTMVALVAAELSHCFISRVVDWVGSGCKRMPASPYF